MEQACKNMYETAMTQADKEYIQKDIKMSYKFLFWTLVFLNLFIYILFGLILLFGVHPTEGFEERLLFIAFLLNIPFLGFFSWLNLLKYFDLKRSTKWVLTITEYKIKKRKLGFAIQAKLSRKLKFDVFKDLTNLKENKPVTVEITKWSKTVLLISQDKENF